MKRFSALPFAFLPSLALACSGPGVQETMKGVELSARYGAAGSALLTLASALFRLRVAFLVCLVLLLVHPAWTMSPYSGDCGDIEEGAVLLLALLSMSVFAWDLLRGHRRSPRP